MNTSNPAGALGAFATVAGLVGTGWEHYVRILHPAHRSEEGSCVPVTWSELARSRGRSVDLSVASWFDVTGVRPHQDLLPEGVDVEPGEGEDAGDVVSRVTELLDPHASQLHVAEWTGYGGRQAADLATSLIKMHNETYAERVASAAELTRLLAEDEAWPHSPAVIPNLVWSPGRWCLAADIDCMSTYLGSDVGLSPLESLELEWFPVDPQARVS